MRILFVSLLFNDAINGGFQYRKSIVECLSNISGAENLDLIVPESDAFDNWPAQIVKKLKPVKSIFKKIENCLRGNVTQISKTTERFILHLVKENRYDYVIFGSSEAGNLAKIIKEKSESKVITFCNDIICSFFQKRSGIKEEFLYKVEMKAERLSSKFSDKIVVLHERDGVLLEKFYFRKADAFFPICLKDSFVKSKSIYKGNFFKLLFVGSYNWSPNKEAILWFINNVMSRITNPNIIFEICGYQTEQIANEFSLGLPPNVKILGTIEDLSCVYSQANLVVEPLISGSGMKVKTAEALMFGKPIIGTSEAIEGYPELSNCICRTSSDFIRGIQKAYLNNLPGYSKYNRELFLKKYSLDAGLIRMKAILD